MPEDPGTIAHILEILSYLDRPRNALAVGVENLIDEDPQTGFWGGAYSGLTGERERSWADLFGVERPQSTDEWLPWLGKGALHLGGDALLDPLLVLGPLSKLGKAGKLGTPIARGLEALGAPYRAASEYVHGTGLGRAFAHDVPAHFQEEYSRPLQTAMREKEERIAQILKLFQEGKPLEANIKDIATARQAWERPYLESQVSPEVENFWSQLWGLSREAKDRVNEIAMRISGKPLIGEVTENDLLRFLPRIATEQGRRYLRQKGLTSAKGLRPETFESRELQLLVDPEAWARGELKYVMPEGKPVVTKLDYELSGLKPTDTHGYTLTRGEKTLPVTPVQATLKEILESGVAPKRSWIQGVSESYLADILRKENQQAFLTWIERGLQTGKEGGWIKPIENLMDIPKNWRQLKVKGLEKYAAPKWAANDIEKRARKLYDVDSPMGMLEQMGDAVLNTRIGGLFREATQWWKRNVLGMHPGYYIGNAISDMPLMYSAGVDAWMIPFRKGQAIALQTGLGSRIFRNYTNKELGEEFARRGLWSRTWGGSEVPDELQKAMKQGFLRRNLADLPGPAGTIGRGVTKVGEKWGSLNDALLSKVGGNIEANSRLGVAVDWLKRNKIKSPNAIDLDRAAAFANQKMIDYSALTPFERQLAMIVPFLAFSRGMLGRFAEDVVSSPDRLARLARFLDTTLEPMSSEDKRISDAWIRENAPTFGAFGMSWDDIMARLGIAPRQEGQRMALAGRFLPWTQVEALTSRPSDTVLSSINPLLKGPAELVANYSTFKDRPIDALEGFPQSLNPYRAQLATQSLLGLRLPATWDYMLTQMPGGRTLGVVSELLRSTGLTKDPYKAETSPGEFLSWYGTGGKLYPFDRTKQLTRRWWDLDRKTKEIEKKARFAWARDDRQGVEHYVRLLREHQEKIERMFGFVEGGT